MSQDNLLKLKSTESKHVYYTRRKKKKDGSQQKLEIKKYDPRVRKHVVFKEAKK